MVNKFTPLGVVPLDYKETHGTTRSGDFSSWSLVHTCWQWETLLEKRLGHDGLLRNTSGFQ
jgi:hypothetical protein